MIKMKKYVLSEKKRKDGEIIDQPLKKRNTNKEERNKLTKNNKKMCQRKSINIIKLNATKQEENMRQLERK